MTIFKRINNRRGFTLMEIVLVLGIFSTSLLLVMNIFTTSANLQRRTLLSQRLTRDARYTMETMARSVRMGTVDYDFYKGRTDYISIEQVYFLNNPVDPLHVLALLDQDGNRTIIRRRSLNPEFDPWGKNVSDDNNLPELGDKVEICLETSICVTPNYGGNKNECNSNLDCAESESCELSCNFYQSWSDITPDNVRLTGGSQYPGEPYGLKFFIIPEEDPFRISDPIEGEYAAYKQPFVRINLVTKGLGDSEDERKTNYIQTAIGSRYYGR
ncbi:MAG: type II secretion system protein [bacterium]